MKSENSCNATPSTTQAIKKVSGNCMETKLVGGASSTKQAVEEYQIHIPSLKEITSLVLSANSLILSQFNSLVTFSTKFLSNAIASVEKYVLTSILRI
jgi:deoxyribose-phosphate aldolase